FRVWPRTRFPAGPSPDTLSYLGQGDAFRIGHPQSGRKSGSEDPVFRRQILIPHDQFLVLRAVKLQSDEPSIPTPDRFPFSDAGDLAKHLAPKPFPISAKVTRSGSYSCNRADNLALRIWFSTARYSFRSRSSWFTEPVT